MPTQTIVWTAVPTGVTGTGNNRHLQLSILVAPRLRADASEGDTLALWPDFLDWTQLMQQNVAFQVTFDDGPPINATLDDSALEPSLWPMLFNRETFVRPHMFDDYQPRQIISYPTRQLHRAIKRLYQEAGTQAPEGVAPTPPLTWQTTYLNLGTEPGLNATVFDIATHGRFAYATHYTYDPNNANQPTTAGRLVKINLESRETVASVTVGHQPRSVAVNPLTNTVYVVNRGHASYSLMIIRDDGNLGEPVEIRLGQGPTQVAVSPARNRVFITNPFQGRLHVLDGTDGRTLTDVVLGTGVIGVTVDDDEDAVYVTVAHRSVVPAVDRVAKLVPDEQAPPGTVRYREVWRTEIPPEGSEPVAVAVDSERERVYVGNLNPVAQGGQGPGVTILGTETGAVISTVPTQGIALRLAASARFGYAYAPRSFAVVIIGRSNRVVGTIPHELSVPIGVAVHPDTQQVVVGDGETGRLMIATPSSTDPPDELGELFPSWDVPWTPEAEQAARDNLAQPNVEGRDLTSRVLLFHRRPPEDEAQLPQDAELRTLLDFHEALATLGDYPQIMRRLGLVLDLEIPAASAPAGAETVRVLPTVSAATTPGVEVSNVSTQTACVWDGTRFAAREASADILDGLLTLDDERYELVQVDLDGAALKLVNAAPTLLRSGVGTVVRNAPPALRSAGVALVRDGHAAVLRERFNRSLAHNNALVENRDVILFAEDLVRGYCIDVWDGTSQSWHSLCQRSGIYTFGADGQHKVGPINDEGIIQIGVAEAAAPSANAPDDVYLHEAMCRWENWSLVAGRPGKAVDADGTPQDADNTPVTPFKLQVNFTPVDHSLPKLRFGRTYRMRARVVNLAGNSLTLDQAPDVGLPEQPDRFAYLRYEPVPWPAVVLRAPLTPQTPGEALERLVIRTTNTDPAQDDVPGIAVGERHIVPPRSSVQLAEIHGALDDADGTLRADAEMYRLLRDRDASQLRIDPDTEMPVDDAPQLSVPYLTDPLSRGATLRNLPGAPAGTTGQADGSGTLVYTPFTDRTAGRGSATQVGWDADWPQQRPFRLVVEDGAEPPRWDAVARVLTVGLPKGEVARVPLSSFLLEDDLALMGVWQWLREYADERITALFERVDRRDVDTLDQLARQLLEWAHYARYGGHALLSPARELTLVHAVQQPLGHPVWTELDVRRRRDETLARLRGGLQIHGNSTASVELRARWDEPIDDPNAGAPQTHPGQAVLVDIPVPAPGEPLDVGRPYITVNAGGLAVARYHPAADQLEFTGQAMPQHVFGDTKHRVVRYRAAATSRFREYFTPDAAGGFVRESAEIIVRVPSSARPAPPRVLYAVPTYGWDRQTESNVITSRRQGHGLRIYLARSWYSSGNGELLGVVIWPGQLTDDERVRLKPFVSQVGADPIVASSGAAQLTRDSFGTDDTVWGNELRLEGLGNFERIDVAGHPVAYDAERDRWYCDIAIDPNLARHAEAYGALVRLALVRYQPDSLPGLELSRAVTTEFMQVAPDRSAIATYDPYNPGVVRLVVTGQTYRATADQDGRVQPDGTFLQVTVEERWPDVQGDLGWRPAPATAAAIHADQVHTIDTVLWRGRIHLPADRQPEQFRIVIKEFESWLDDAAIQSLDSPEPLPRARRLIYAETLVL